MVQHYLGLHKSATGHVPPDQMQSNYPGYTLGLIALGDLRQDALQHIYMRRNDNLFGF